MLPDIFKRELHRSKVNNYMAMVQRLAQLGEEINRIEDQLYERQRILFALWRRLPNDQQIRKAELRLQNLRAEQHWLILELTNFFRGGPRN